MLAPGDAPIPGTTLTLSAGGITVATTTTAADGDYNFTCDSSGNPLLPGTYKLTETQPAGYDQGRNTVGTNNGKSDGSLVPVDMIGSIVLASGQQSINDNFGEVKPGGVGPQTLSAPVTISGNVYYDQLGTGMLAAGDLPIPGTTLTLSSGGITIATTTTAADGTYSFTSDSSGNPLVAGTYTVTETQPTDYLQGSNTVGTVNGTTDGVLVPVDNIGSIVLAPGQNSVQNNFGELLGSLCGFVYVDANGDGLKESNERGIGGVTLVLTGQNDPGTIAPETLTTNADGSYCFMNLFPGNYTVTEPANPPGYRDGLQARVGVVIPNSAGSRVVPGVQLAIGELMSENNDFGTLTPPSIGGVQRFGVHMQPVQVVLTVTQQMDPASTENLHDYQLIGPGGRRVPISSAVYDAATQSVTLTGTARSISAITSG